ncbi:MAG: hypothetical protein JWQ98_1584 [Chlorobi bacterium]|nr:hypothetical protein [Chlorobiota bacterium]
MNCSTTSAILLLIALIPASCLHAQTSDDDSGAPGESALAGVDRIGIYAGANAGLQLIEGKVLPFPPGGIAPVNSPAGISGAAGIVYSRLLPNLFITRPPAGADSGDTARLYRKITTFQIRFLYNRIAGASQIAGEYPRAGGDENVPVRQTVSSTIDIVAAEPALLFDLASMGSRASPMMSLGISLGHINAAVLNSELTPTGPGADTITLKPDVTRHFTVTRTFYAALLLGGGARINLGSGVMDSPAIVPQLELVIPLTSIAAEARWLPLGLRIGVGFHYPL